MRNSEHVPPEDKEKWVLDRERNIETLKDYCKVERVIDSNEGPEETEYRVKCKDSLS